jgi:hypothetical protein
MHYKALKIALVATSFARLTGLNVADEGPTHRLQRELFAVLRWEILWNQSPAGFHRPLSGTAKFAIALARDTLSYCSHDLGVCAMYRIGDYRNFEGINSALCSDDGKDEDTLRTFIGTVPKLSSENQHSRPSPIVAEHGLGRPSTKDSVAIWTTTASLGTRREIIQQYKRMHPPELVSLQKWLRAENGVGEGLTVTVPCFAATDPLIFISIDERSGEHAVETVFWNREAKIWESADGFGPPVDPAIVAQFREVTKTIACSTMRF